MKNLRKIKNVSQEILGNHLGVTSNAIYSWEANRTQPSIEMIVKIAEYFEVSTDYLLGLNQEDAENIEKLKIALKEAGLMFGEDLTKEELEKALKIVEMLKEK